MMESHARLDDFDAAHPFARRVVSHHPLNAQAWYVIGKWLVDQGKEDLAQVPLERAEKLGFKGFDAEDCDDRRRNRALSDS